MATIAQNAILRAKTAEDSDLQTAQNAIPQSYGMTINATIPVLSEV